MDAAAITAIGAALIGLTSLVTAIFTGIAMLRQGAHGVKIDSLKAGSDAIHTAVNSNYTELKRELASSNRDTAERDRTILDLTRAITELREGKHAAAVAAALAQAPMQQVSPDQPIPVVVIPTDEPIPVVVTPPPRKT